MHDDRPSATAQWVAFFRGLSAYDTPPLTADPLALHLLDLPYRPLLAAADRHPRLARLALRGLHVVGGGRHRFMALRTRAIDDHLRAFAAQHAPSPVQVVILGAGLDARAWRLALSPAAWFEVDHPATQGRKRARAPSAPPDDHRFVPINFERDALADTLLSHGFDPSLPTFCVWEGVTMYLTLPAIEATLAAAEALLPPGSQLAVSYLTRSGGLPGERLALGGVVRIAGERLQTLLDPPDLAALLSRAGFAVTEDAGFPEWSARYLGPRHHSRWDLERVTLATRREREG